LIPRKSDLPTRGVPYLTVGIIAVNLAVFAYQFMLSPPAERTFILELGLGACRSNTTTGP